MVTGGELERNRRFDAHQEDSQLTRRNRKLVGTIVMILSLFVYPLAMTIIYEQLLIGAAQWVLLIYFVVAGLAWGLPIAGLIKWMSREDDVATE